MAKNKNVLATTSWWWLFNASLWGLAFAFLLLRLAPIIERGITMWGWLTHLKFDMTISLCLEGPAAFSETCWMDDGFKRDWFIDGWFMKSPLGGAMIGIRILGVSLELDIDW